MDYHGVNVWGGREAENPAQFAGKATGILSVHGTLYAWFAGPASTTVPITRLIVSRDHSRTWEFADWRLTQEDHLFAGVFIQAGRDHSSAPDGYVYACFTHLDDVPAEQRNWIHEVPGKVDLARVTEHRVLDREAWEWFAGLAEDGQAQWTTDLTRRTHCFADPNGIKIVSACWQPALQRYLLVYNPKGHPGNFALFEAPQPWGPWSQVAYLPAHPLFKPGPDDWRVSLFHFAPKWWSDDARDFTLIYNTADDAWNSVRGRFSLAER